MRKPTRVVLVPLVALGMTVVAVVVVASMHWFYVRKPNIVAVDDGYTVALAERLIDRRWLPYVDGCSHRGPVLYWTAALGQALFGRYSWASARWLMMLVSLVTVGGLTGAGFAARLPLAGGIASLMFAFLALVGHPTPDGAAVLGENVASAFGAVALCFCAWAVNSRASLRVRLALFGLSGASIALAGLTKQTALPLALPLFVWSVAHALSMEGAARRERWLVSAAFLAGCVLPCLVVLVRYAIARELGTFWYWFYTYNAEIYAKVSPDTSYKKGFDIWMREHTWMVALTMLIAAWGIVRPLTSSASLRDFPRAHAAAGLEASVAWMALFSIVPMVLAKRFWPSYELLPFPYVAMGAGVLLARSVSLSAEGSDFWPRFSGVVLLGSLLSGWVGYSASSKLKDLVERRKAGGYQPALPEPLCDLVDKHSKPGEPLFVWGFDGDIYVTCHRAPATRFTYLTLVAGTVPPAWSDPRPEWVARDSRRQLLEDLRLTTPPVVLDMPGKMGNVSLSVVPELTAYLKANYCEQPSTAAKDGRKAAVWVRGDRCPAK